MDRLPGAVAASGPPTGSTRFGRLDGADVAVPKLCPHDLATVVSKLWKLSSEEPDEDHEELGEHPIEAWSAGATFLWDLLQQTGATAADALAAAEHTSYPEA